MHLLPKCTILQERYTIVRRKDDVEIGFSEGLGHEESFYKALSGLGI